MEDNIEDTCNRGTRKMRTAAPRKGRDHDTLLPGPAAVAVFVMLAALTAAWPAQHAAAQSAPCTAIQDDAERLACYDRALRATSPAPVAPAPTARAPAATATQAPAPAAQAPAVQAPTGQAPATPGAQASPAPPPTTATPASSANGAKDVIPIVIVSVRTVPGRETSFTTKDGATWMQTDSQRLYGLPDTPFDAELKPGAVGSTFLVPKSGKRAIRVKLVER
jgi:nucleoid-associated protein YgaU